MKKIILSGLFLFAGIPCLFSQTFSNTTDYNIPDNDPIVGVYSDIVVSGVPPTATIANVTINITHSWDSDLDIVLVDPLNNEHYLASNNGGSGDNFTNTVFSNGASTSIASGAAPFTGSFIPLQPLPTGLNPNGTWRLWVTDWASGDLGVVRDWSITFSAPSCPIVGFNGLPATMACNDTAFVYANDSATANGAIFPTLFFQFSTHANGAASNAVRIYEDGALIYEDNYGMMDNNTVLTVYAIGPFLSPSSNYTIQVCNNGGVAPMEWVVYDGNGYTHASGTTPAGCTNYGPWSPQGSATWSIAPVGTPGLYPTDWGAAGFWGEDCGPGNYQITYNWNNQSPIPGYGCTGSQTQNITVTNPWNGSWNSPGTICASGGSINLNSYITGNTGGTWSGTGVTGSTFNPSGLSGAYSITYTVGNSTACRAIVTQTITVQPLATANAGSDRSICSGSTVSISGASYGGSASGCSWSTSGSGSFTNGNTTTPTYTPSAGDISSGSVTLTMTTTGPCASATDNLVLTITPLDNANFSYTSGTFCQTASNPTPSISLPGGSFSSSPAGLSLNTVNGTINLASSTTGTYTVTYTTIGTCPNNSSVSVSITSGFDAEFSYSGPYCQYGSNPLPSHSTGSNGIYSSTAGLVFVNTSTGQIDLTSSSPGNYTVTNTIAASGGCAQAVSTNSVTITAAPIVSAGSDNTICSGSTLVVGGATMGGSASSVTWTTSGSGSFLNGSTLSPTYNPSPADISAGSVTLTVTTDDPPGVCTSVSDNLVLTLNLASVVNAGNDATICEGQTYALAGTMSGATSNVNWSTSGDGNFSDVTSLTAIYTPGVNDITAGTVNLTLTGNDPDGSGPCALVTDVITLSISEAATIDAGSDTEVCSGENASLTAIPGGSASLVNWTSSGTGSFASATSATTTYTPSAADILAGTVNLTISVTDPDGSGPCSSVTDNLNLTIHALPLVDSIITTQVTSCLTPNATINIYASGALGPFEYSINNGANYSAVSSYTGLNVGNYIVLVRNTEGCINGTTVALTSASGPQISSVDNTDLDCSGDTDGTITIHAQGAVSFSIDGGSNFEADSVFTGLTEGLYNIIVEDAGGCQDVSSVQITAPSPLSLDSSVTDAGCGITGSATVSVSGGSPAYTYLWSNTQTTASITGLIAGNYTVTVTDNNGCTAILVATVGFNTGSLTVDSATEVDVDCNGDSTGSVTVNMTSGTAPYTYVWSHNAGLNSAIADDLPTGSYTVTVTDAMGCSGTYTATISQPSQLNVVVATSNVSCYGLSDGAISTAVSGGNPAYSYLWSDGQTTSSATGLAQGTYALTVTDQNGCIRTVVEISVFEPTALSLSTMVSNPACYDGSNGSISVIATGGTTPYNYNWSNSDTSAIITGLNAGTYTLTLTDDHYCVATIAVPILNPPAMTITDTVYVDSGNDGVIDILTVSGGLSPFTYLWSNGSTSQDIGGLESGTYIVTITDGNTCALIDTFVVTVNDLPIEIPTAITPNGDLINDDFEILNIQEIETVSVQIFSRWGDELFIFDGTGPQYADPANRWDGTVNGTELPTGSYLYIITLSSMDEPVTGVVAIIR